MEQFEKRMKDSNYGLNGRAYLEPEDVSRAVLYLVTDDEASSAARSWRSASAARPGPSAEEAGVGSLEER